MTTELDAEVVSLLQQGKKIEAIKKLRELKTMGLKEAKEEVDAYCSENAISNASVTKVGSGNGFVYLLVLGLIAYLLFKQFG